MLSYLQVHIYYTLPVLGFLLLISRPFHSKLDTLKYAFVSTIAFATATPWDNYIVYHRAWWYCSSCVVAVIGYVPLEEYMFFIIMTLMTIAFTNLVMRWELPSFYIKSNSSVIRSLCIRVIPSMVFLAIGIIAWYFAIPNTRLFYGCCILGYVCPVLSLLWLGTGEYIVRRWKAVLISITVPTIYLSWVDKVAIGAGTWHISLRTSTGWMVAQNLPVEEFAFFLLINVVLVFATCAIDRADAILHLTGQIPNGSLTQWAYLLRLTKAFFQLDQVIDKVLLHDLDVTWKLLREASKSFHTASAVFPTNIRQDLGILYGFCRVTDDIADNEMVPAEKRMEQIRLIRNLVYSMFNNKTCNPSIDWDFYANNLPADCLSACRAMSQLRHSLELNAIEELLDGYAFDLNRESVPDETTLIRYCGYVASSVGEMCTRLMLAHTNIDNETLQWTIQRARSMGLVLQFVNIARDIVTDSQILKRTYLPSSWLTDKEQQLLTSGEGQKLGNKRLQELAARLIQGGKEILPEATLGINQLPHDCQGGVYAACFVYCGIADELLTAKTYPRRAHVSGMKRAWISFKSIYGLGTSNFTMTHIPPKKFRKGKQRAFII